ncbi:MAG: NAD-dependent epimerase/dehydratase family protein [Solirubrobacterales bacterium]|nr:NAD-dependent epimerase/dehydratase family protein [Solirubrobacterales bacterium]
MSETRGRRSGAIPPQPARAARRAILKRIDSSGDRQTATEVLITGGAGFIGSSLGIALAGRHPQWRVTALDNLYRSGSELNLPRLERAGVRFLEGDVRSPDELARAAHPDVLIECSAEPSVMSGTDGDTSYLFHTNLTGAYNCLELARRSGAFFIFLSTSRVYPLAALEGAALEETPTRFELAADQPTAGLSASGVSEAVPLGGARTLYGTTKLAAEMLLEEYRAAFGLRGVIDRCGVIAGPWQMGKVDQGVFTHWMLAHRFGLPLSYVGFGGSGKQVRDLLHVEDLVDLVERQVLDADGWDGRTLNVGGGRECSLSLLEATTLCREITGREIPIGSVPETRAGDVPVYISDCAELLAHTDWRPRRGAAAILGDIHAWIEEDPEQLAEALGIEWGGAR